MVDCSGLENLAGNPAETAEMADFCGSEAAQDAPFTERSAAQDGNKVGTAPEPVGKVVWLDEDTYTCDALYFIEDVDAGAIKIGRGGNPVSRLATMQTGNPRRLTLIDSISNQGWQEAFWHCAWQFFRIRGEWFEATAELRAAIKEIRAGGDWTDHVPPLVLLDDGEVPEIGEWQEHMLDAFDAYEEVALIGCGPDMRAKEAAARAIFDPDFDGRCIVTRYVDAVRAATPPLTTTRGDAR